VAASLSADPRRDGCTQPPGPAQRGPVAFPAVVTHRANCLPGRTDHTLVRIDRYAHGNAPPAPLICQHPRSREIFVRRN